MTYTMFYNYDLYLWPLYFVFSDHYLLCFVTVVTICCWCIILLLYFFFTKNCEFGPIGFMIVLLPIIISLSNLTWPAKYLIFNSNRFPTVSIFQMLLTKIELNFVIQNFAINNSGYIPIQGIYLHIRGVGVGKFQGNFVVGHII